MCRLIYFGVSYTVRIDVSCNKFYSPFFPSSPLLPMTLCASRRLGLQVCVWSVGRIPSRQLQ